MFAVVHMSLERLMRLTSQVVTPEHTLTFHNRILRAIARKNPEEARARMEEHLLDAKELLIRAVDRQDQEDLQSRISVLTSANKKPRRARDVTRPSSRTSSA
jgi:DNA-binding GntR family transcriptional regulator